MKICPREGLELAVRDVRGVMVAQCSTCSGIWIPGRIVSQALGAVHPAVRPTRTAISQRCPDDQSPLIVLHYHGVEIDRCERCGGVWLDHGELERIIRQKKAVLPPQSTPKQPPKQSHARGSALGDFAGDAAADLTVEAIGLVFEFLGDALSGL